MYKKNNSTTSKLLKSLMVISLGAFALQGCKKDAEPTPANPVNVDSVYTITNIPSTDNYIKVKAILKKKYQGIVNTATFELSSNPDFKDSKTFLFDGAKPGSLDSIGFETNLIFFNQTIYTRLYTNQQTENGAVDSYSQTKTYKTNPFPYVKGAKFVLGYNDSLFTIDTNGSNLKFLSAGRNIGRNGKVIQLGDTRLQNNNTYEIIRDATLYDDLEIKDFSLDGSKLIAIHKNIHSSILIYENGQIIKELSSYNLNLGEIDIFSFDGSKVLYEKEIESINLYDVKNNSDIQFGYGAGVLNKTNSKIIITERLLSFTPPRWEFGSLKICEPIANGANSGTTLIPFDSDNKNTQFVATHPIFSEDESLIYFIGMNYTSATNPTDADIYSIPVTGGSPTKITNYHFNFYKINTKLLFKLVNFE